MKLKGNLAPKPRHHQQTNNDYYRWICDILKVNKEDNSYWLLFGVLHKKIFRWSVPNDDNRGLDGIRLRDEYLYENGYDDNDNIDGPCTMLEMLMGLARRMNDNMADLHNHDQTSKWFWELLSNVGLDKFTDEEYYDEFKADEVDYILDTIIDRAYRRDGRGGLFPLKHPRIDQRRREIWYQMCDYLVENYYVEDRIV